MAMEKYDVIKRLGVGAHGAVFLVKHFNTKRLFALKKIEVDENRKTRTREAILKEASILSQLKHPHIVLFHECFLDPSREYVCIILDYCDGGSLADKIQNAAQNAASLSEKQIMQWFIQIVMAVQYIHSKHILHRDLKTENVFLNKRNVVKLGDFGISKILDNTIDVAKTVVGTPSYLSPELCQDIPYNSKSDIWAIGCLLYEMCALDRPFDGQSLIRLFFNIVKAEYKPMPPDAPPGIVDLVARMLVKEPENRPSASAILNLPYVKEHLASFISDTESFRTGRSRKEDGVGAGGGDAANLLSPGNKSHKPFRNKSPGDAPKVIKCGNSPGLQHHPAPTCSRPWPSPKANKRNHRIGEVDDNAESNLDKNVQGRPKDVIRAALAADDEEYYSDDFDSSASEIEEDLPPNGDAGDIRSEDDAVYVDDFEDYESDEDLAEVVNQAREAQALQPCDDFFAEDREDEMALSQTLTQTDVFRSHINALRSGGKDSSS